jgi:putative restriction endonuclease
VPFRNGDHYYESALRRADGGTSKGAFGRAVRVIPDQEYDFILKAGFARVLNELRPAQAASPHAFPGFADDPPTEFERPIIERIIARPFRDAAFATAVKSAYSDTCAMTGLKIINGGGRSEVQAAHIRPVASSGPDSVRNGLALCGTVHWMFDRGLVSIDDDYSLLIANRGIPEGIGRMINSGRRLLTPERPELLPHPKFLRFHRENVFKG